jgi:hypothetical protein
MATAFAALEARINAAVDQHLANATADFGGGTVVDGTFDSDYGDPLGIVAGQRMVFSSGDAVLASIAVGASVTINATVYKVAEIQREGSGWTRLILK